MRLFHLRQGFGGLGVRRSSAAPLSVEWLYVACCTWFVIGLFLDGWAHNHVPELETFFTPWHAVFYSGYFLMAGTLFGLWVKTRATGIPAGYREAMVGAIVFLFGGVGDMLWHEIFGIEQDIEALFSPTHLVLALGTVLMLGAPFLRVLRTGTSAKTFAGRLPAILSVTYIASAVMFLTQFHHWSDLRLIGDLPIRQTAELHQALAMAGYIWHIAVLMAAAVMLLRSMPPALGTNAVLFTVSTFGMAVMRQWEFADAVPLVCIAYIAGLAADAWALRVWPIDKHLGAFRWFTAGVPAVLLTLLHGYAIAMHGTWWSVHMWTGAVAVVACVGTLVGLAMVPPAKR